MSNKGEGIEKNFVQREEKDQILVVKNYIFSLLCEEKLRVGERLPSEKALSEQLQVTKSAVRDGLQSLKTVGLLSSVRGSGYRLTADFDHSLGDILHAMVVYSSASRRDVREVWEALEIRVLELLIKNGVSEQIMEELKKVQKTIHSFRGKEIQTAEDVETLVEADFSFHRLLAYSSGNTFIRAFFIALNGFHSYGRDVAYIRRFVSDELVDTHETILQAIQQSDLEMGVKAVREHYAICSRVAEGRKEDSVLHTTITELQEKGFTRQQIMEKLMELE